MSDSIKGAVAEVSRNIKDSVGEMIEQGVQSIIAPQLTPQQIQQKQIEDQKNLAEARRKIAFYQNTDQDLKRVRQASEQKKSQRIQAQQQEAQTKKAEKMQVRQGSKKPGIALPEEIARTRQEIGKGHGVGG